MYEGLQRVRRVVDKELRSDKIVLRRPVRSFMRDKTWSNLFLSLYDKLPADLRVADTRKLKDKRRLVEWVRSNIDKT